MGHRPQSPNMQLSITADYVTSRGCPEPYLRRIAEAGFIHVHWGYHYHTDFMYSRWEIDRIDRWLHAFGLQVLDLHASAGVESGTVDWPRLAALIAKSAYRKCVSMEVMTRYAAVREEADFLSRARETGMQLARMIHDAESRSASAVSECGRK